MTNLNGHSRVLPFGRLLASGFRWLLRNPRDVAVAATGMPGASLRELGRTLLRGLPWSGDACTGIKLVGVTSCRRGAGVSTIARLMAATAAGGGSHQVLLIDGGIDHSSSRRPVGGLQTSEQSDVSTSWDDGQFQLKPTQTPNLHVLVASCEESGVESEAFDALRTVLADCRERFDLVVVDMPAFTESQVARRLVSHLDGVVFVVGDEHIQREDAQRLHADIERSGGKILGIVLNKEHQQIPDWLYRSL